MARFEQDRENLLGEATALVERVELRPAGWEENVVAGFRRDGAASFYFGANLVFQFNTNRELRRGYRDGMLLAADGGKLVSVTRQREVGEVRLMRHALSTVETQAYLELAKRRLEELDEAIRRHGFRLVGQVPTDGDVPLRVSDWLSTLGDSIQIANQPGLHSR